MLRDGSRYLDNGRLLERVGADHPARHLAGDGDEWDGVEQRVGEGGDEVGGPGTGGGDADAGLAGGASVALSGKGLALLVAEEVVGDGSVNLILKWPT